MHGVPRNYFIDNMSLSQQSSVSKGLKDINNETTVVVFVESTPVGEKMLMCIEI